MEGEVLKYGWLIVLTLAQIIYLWVKMAEKRTNKKKDCKPAKPDDPENPGHGERIGILETEVENLKENNEKDHGLIRGDIRKIFNLINGMRK